MKTALTVFFAQFATYGAILGLELGRSWISEGYGLHPILAGAAILALILAPYVAAWRVRAW